MAHRYTPAKERQSRKSGRNRNEIIYDITMLPASDDAKSMQQQQQQKQNQNQLFLFYRVGMDRKVR